MRRPLTVRHPPRKHAYQAERQRYAGRPEHTRPCLANTPAAPLGQTRVHAAGLLPASASEPFCDSSPMRSARTRRAKDDRKRTKCYWRRKRRHILETPLGTLPLTAVTAARIKERQRDMEQSSLARSYINGRPKDR